MSSKYQFLLRRMYYLPPSNRYILPVNLLKTLGLRVHQNHCEDRFHCSSR